MRRMRWMLVSLALLLVLATASCAPKAAPSPAEVGGKVATTVASAQQAAVGRGTPSVVATAKPAPTTAAAGKADELVFAEVKQLDKFSSYRLLNKYSTSSGKGESMSWEVLNEVVRQPPASRTVTKVMEKGKEQTPMETIRIGDAMYNKYGDEWMAVQNTTQNETMNTLLSPDLYFGNEKGKLVGRETVNGVATRHYRWDAVATNPMLKVSKIEEWKADVWVSEELQVYVRTAVHMVGVDDKGVKVTFDIVSDLTDINKPITIKAPEGVAAPKLPDDVPVMEGATDLLIFGSESAGLMATFKTAKSAAEVTKFYGEQMKAKGWTAAEVVVPQMLAFDKATRQAQVMISAEGTKTSVAISLRQGEGAPKPTSTKAVTSPTATKPATAPTATRPAAAAPTLPPVVVTSLVADIPLLEGAKNLDQAEDSLSYDVAKPMLDAGKALRDKFTAAEWKVQEASEDNAAMVLVKDKRTATVELQEGDGITYVLVWVVAD